MLRPSFERGDARPISHARVLLAVSIWLASPAPVFAEAGACQLIPDDRNPSEKMLRCGDNLTIRSAAESRYRLTDQNDQDLQKDELPRQGLPKGARLDSGALMIEFKPSEGRRNFQIRTPHAIAAVRGTTWAVEVEPEKTSTLVILGFVEVRRPDANSGALLRAGQGSDVSPGTGPVMVKRWAKRRVDALLARFGQ
jgi:FecR protein